MKKTLFIIVVVNSGGLENYLLRFLEHYSGQIDAYVICKSGNVDGTLSDEYKNVGVKLIPFKLRYFNLFDYIKFYSFLKNQNFYSITDFTGNFSALPLLTAKFARVKNRIAFFRKDTNIFKETFSRLLYNNIMNLILPKVATSILSNSKSALNNFFKNWNRIPGTEVIYNGIDSKRFLSSSEDLRDELKIPCNSYVIGNIARYNEAKNHETIIKVGIELCKKYDDIYFIICGRNTDVYLKDKVLKENLGGKIKVLGERRDIVKVLNTLDCFYFPSLSEGQPNALIEALIKGIPFVASNIEPNKESIPDFLHEQLVPPQDVDTAINKLIEIKNSVHLKEQLNVSEWAIRNYDPAFQFSKFYDKLVE